MLLTVLGEQYRAIWYTKCVFLWLTGRGNSAFETATHIYGATNLIHMIARSRVRLSWATHYVGDLR